MTAKEYLAAVSVLAVVFGVPIAVLSYENHLTAPHPSNAQVITLTGIGTQGIWTLDNVVGHNYWQQKFERATIRLEAQRPVILRLKSADVTHKFYSPALKIGPVVVEPGYVAVVEFVALDAGTYQYYCVAVCGECHAFMHGDIVVHEKGESAPAEQEPPTSCRHADVVLPQTGDPVASGQYLFDRYGCTTCHGAKRYEVVPGLPPDLSYAGNKLRPEWIRNFLLKPHPIRYQADGVRSALRMPNFHLSEEEANALTAYLALQMDSVRFAPLAAQWESTTTQVEEGKQLFASYQCLGCHRLGSEGNRIGPDLTHVGSRVKPEYLDVYLTDPKAIIPGTPMKDFQLWDEERAALVAFLQSLK